MLLSRKQNADTRVADRVTFPTRKNKKIAADFLLRVLVEGKKYWSKKGGTQATPAAGSTTAGTKSTAR